MTRMNTLEEIVARRRQVDVLMAASPLPSDELCHTNTGIYCEAASLGGLSSIRKHGAEHKAERRNHRN